MTKSGKHCGKRRNCSIWAISSFVTMFSKSRLLYRHQNASIWGKGLTAKINVTMLYQSMYQSSKLLIWPLKPMLLVLKRIVWRFFWVPTTGFNECYQRYHGRRPISSPLLYYKHTCAFFKNYHRITNSQRQNIVSYLLEVVYHWNK